MSRWEVGHIFAAIFEDEAQRLLSLGEEHLLEQRVACERTCAHERVAAGKQAEEWHAFAHATEGGTKR